eukprot:6155308-Alexandrium_andersonii.AAC.1
MALRRCLHDTQEFGAGPWALLHPPPVGTGRHHRTTKARRRLRACEQARAQGRPQHQLHLQPL